MHTLRKPCTVCLVAVIFLLLLTNCAVTSPTAQQQRASPSSGVGAGGSSGSRSASPTPSSSPPPPTLPAGTAADEDGRTAAQKAYHVYPIPAACSATPFVGPDKRHDFPAWWLEGQGIVAGTPLGVLFQGGNKLHWQLTTAAPLQVTGASRDGQQQPLNVALLSGIGTGTTLVNGTTEDYLYSSVIVFPTPGCWSVRANAGPQRLNATVYIYPFTCKPLSLRERDEPNMPVNCTPSK